MTSKTELNFQRIKKRQRLDINNVPFKLEYYDFLINHYEKNEEFEKCQIILSERNKILNHDDNYLL